MADLVVIGYPDKGTAEQAMAKLGELQKGLVVQLAGASIISRDAEGKLHNETPSGATGMGAASGALWGTLIGLLFFVPFAGLLIGGIFGALFGKLSDVGIKDEWRQQVQDVVKPGQAALAFMVVKATPDKTLEALAPFGGEVLKTSLSNEVEEEIQKALDAHDASAGQAPAAGQPTGGQTA
ncbi:MAG: DUF1269 domain-containing protein [Chloroflexota bacterium]